MQDQLPTPKPQRALPLGLLAGFSVLIVATGSAVAVLNWSTVSQYLPLVKPSAAPVVPPSPAPQPLPEVRSQTPADDRANSSAPVPAQKPTQANEPARIARQETRSPQVYWLAGANNQIDLTASPMEPSGASDQNALLKTAIEKLLAGPDAANLTTTIPKGTRVSRVTVQDGEIQVDLSKEFTSGGGSSSMTARVAQVLYTATSLNPEAKVRFLVEGKPLDVLGGEGLMLDQPLTRKQFEADFK